MELESRTDRTRNIGKLWLPSVSPLCDGDRERAVEVLFRNGLFEAIEALRSFTLHRTPTPLRFHRRCASSHVETLFSPSIHGSGSLPEESGYRLEEVSDEGFTRRHHGTLLQPPERVPLEGNSLRVLHGYGTKDTLESDRWNGLVASSSEVTSYTLELEAPNGGAPITLTSRSERKAHLVPAAHTE